MAWEVTTMYKESIKEVLMRHESMSTNMAEELIVLIRDRYNVRASTGECAYDILEEWLGLEKYTLYDEIPWVVDY